MYVQVMSVAVHAIHQGTQIPDYCVLLDPSSIKTLKSLSMLMHVQLQIF